MLQIQYFELNNIRYACCADDVVSSVAFYHLFDLNAKIYVIKVILGNDECLNPK